MFYSSGAEFCISQQTPTLRWTIFQASGLLATQGRSAVRLYKHRQGDFRQKAPVTAMADHHLSMVGSRNLFHD